MALAVSYIRRVDSLKSFKMNSAQPSKLSKLLSDVARLDPVSIGVSIANWNPDEQKGLEAALQILLRQGSKRVKGEKTSDKADQRVSVIALKKTLF